MSVGDIERAERSLKRSLAKRDMVVAQFGILVDLIHRVREDPDVVPVLQARKKDIELLLTDFRLEQDDILTQLLFLNRDDEFAKIHQPLATRIMEQYYLIHATFTSLGLDNVEKTPTVVGSTIQLPKIPLPSFSGDILYWRPFRDTFESLVHSNTYLSPIQKFHYLLSAVSGSAASVVRSIPLTSVNYSIAWDALNERFDNKRALLTAHLDALFSFLPLTKESLTGLTSFMNTFQENISAIKALEVDDLSGFILFYISSRVLDSTTRRLFESEYHDAVVPTYDLLLEFIQVRCQVLKNSSLVQPLSIKVNDNNNVKRGFQPKSSFIAASSSNPSCIICKENHLLFQCCKFTQKPVKQRFRFARSNKLCMNCLSSYHKTIECNSSRTCKHCSAKHHSLLHLGEQCVSNSPSTSSSSDNSTSPPFVGTSCSSVNVVLGTACVRIQNKNGEWIRVRVLIDTGSQISIITNACASRLGLERSHLKTTVTGLSQTAVSATKGSIACQLIPMNSTQPKIYCEPVILTRITGPMPNTVLPSAIRSAYRHLHLADPFFDVPGHVEFLLGADVYPHIFGQCSQVLHNTGLPSAYETLLGWVILGQSFSKNCSSPVSLSVTVEPSVDSLLKRFWEIEEPVPHNQLFTTDQQCESHFRQTVTRDTTGRFCLALPFKTDPSTLGNSRDMAVARFANLERKLIKDVDLYGKYCAFMDEYERLGHMQLASRPGTYYIPHHAVVKREDQNIKVRVVFDASAKSSSGKSLNDVLHVGPKLQTDISDLIHRCRFYKYMFCADICKMYRQINIREADCQYQYIVWRKHISEPLNDYMLTTVTYGVTASPFQAIRVLRQLEQDDGHLFPSASNILSTQTYVDDIISGHDTIPALLERQNAIIQLLQRAGFELKKWSSNCEDVLRSIPYADRTQEISFDPKDEGSVKILGLHWQPFDDVFTYHTTPMPQNLTKRSVLSSIAKIYDPIGALGPIIFWAKCFMQLLWQSKLQWDDPIPLALSESWSRFSTELPLVKNIKINRFIRRSDNCIIQLVGFSDASEKGYAAVVYFRLIHSDGSIDVTFVTAKSKVAPLKVNNNDKSLTVPRLELCGALLLAQTMNRLMNTFKDFAVISSLYAWTDSRVVLSWLTSPQTQFKIFVTNRLAKISELLPNCKWDYVASELNPADCVSRGLLPSQAVDFKLYWDGPYFLKLVEDDWPHVRLEPITPSTLPDFKETPKVCLTTMSVNEQEWFSRFSTFSNMQRVTAIMLRFISACQKRIIYTGPVTYREQNNALIPIISLVQRRYFSELTKNLRSSTKKVAPRSLAQLAPFVDENNLIRVGGRLSNSSLPSTMQHPILLPKSSTFTTLLIRHYHNTYLHAGSQLILALLSRRYWILSARSAIRQVVFKCVVCARHKSVHPQPIMADLPSSRVTPARPFIHVGIDFAGPFLLKEGRRKNASSVKCYLAIFVCMTVKAIHIEVVSDLSTNALIAALHRFVARRGVPSDVYTDCGTNFKGAAQQLHKQFFDASSQTAYTKVIPCTWHFNPPAAPHFGGIWEAAVKSTKYHLKRVVGNQRLNFEEMSTLSSRIEGILNSRPLTPKSADPHDYHSLSPGDFLIGQPLMDIPEPNVNPMIPTNRLNRWQLLNQLYQSFWKRWSSEYLTSLQSRSKWTKQLPNVEIGDLVLINTPNLPPTQWKLGRIEKTHAGNDGIVRVATVRTTTGVLTRPVVKLAVLPIDKSP